MPLAFQRSHPGGMAENSPAFQRLDRGLGVPSPEGTAELVVLSRPFGTQPSIHPHPALKRRAIFKSPSGTKTRSPGSTYSSNPSGIGPGGPPYVGKPSCGNAPGPGQLSAYQWISSLKRKKPPLAVSKFLIRSDQKNGAPLRPCVHAGFVR